MAVYDLEEQEKLDDLKAWWQQWGNLVTGVVVAVALGILAVQGWRWWQGEQAEQASVLYTAVDAAAKANDVAEGEGGGRAARGEIRRHRLRAARGAARREAAVRCRRRGRRDGAAAIRARPQR